MSKECKARNEVRGRSTAVQPYNDQLDSMRHPLVRVVAWLVLFRTLDLRNPRKMLSLVLSLALAAVGFGLSSCTVYVRPVDPPPPTVYVPAPTYYEPPTPNQQRAYRCRWVFPHGIAKQHCRPRHHP
jgi:hypothetical protein